ncbi:MAG: tRNA pseudouridine(38-40) synthase TruA [Bryobacteraceae bacterium]
MTGAGPGRRIRITFSYDGTDYHGWQVQPDLVTVQSAVEAVVSEIEGERVRVEASGRTDAGVHALAQVAAFRMANPIPVDNLRKAMNRLLPHDIRVTDVREVAAGFHPRYDAMAKTYEYRIHRPEICPPFDRRYVHHYPYPLNEEAMIESAPLLKGEHDFTSFAASDEKDGLGHSKVRRIYSSCMERRGDLLIYRVRGSGFLKHMVRNIAGVLLEVGKGNIGRELFLKRLEPGCGIPSGPTAPALGLFLVSVEYAADGPTS